MRDIESWLDEQAESTASRYGRADGLSADEQAQVKAKTHARLKSMVPLLTALWDAGYDVGDPYELRTNPFYRLPNNAQNVIPILIEYLPETNHEYAQIEIVSAIWHLGPTGNFDGLAAALLSQIQDPRNLAVQEQLANCVAAFAGDSDFKATVNLINNPFAPRDWGLVQALGKMPDEPVVPILRRVMDDPFASEALEPLLGPDAAAIAAELAPTEEVALRRRLFGTVPKADLVDLAVPRATEDHVFGQGGALAAIGLLKLTGFREQVEEFTSHPMRRVREQARKTIKRLR